MGPKPLVLDAISDPKNLEYGWPYGVEYEFRRIVKQLSHASPEALVTSIFCNGHGCLIYREYEGDQMADLSAIPQAILKSSWRIDFGIEPRNVLFVLIGRQEQPRIKLQLFLIHRNAPK